MNKRKLVFFLSVLCAILFLSCSSTPEVEPVTEETPAVEEAPVVEEPVQPVETVKESNEPDYAAQNQQLLDKVLSARDMAIVAGANDRFSEQFAAFDEKLSNLKGQLEANPADQTISAQLQDALDMYQAFEQLSLALTTKERIDSLDFAAYDQTSYDTGVKSVEDIYSMYETQDSVSGSVLLEKSSIALTSFSTALVTGFKTLSNSERTAALQVKDQADEIKANKAAKDEYAVATLKFSQADANFAQSNFEDSYNGFSQAHMDFQSILTTVTEKRNAALEAIERAKQRELEVSQYAEQADTIAPLESVETEEVQ